MSGDAGNINYRAAALLAHRWENGLHGFNRAEEICFKHAAEGRHLHGCNFIGQAVARVVDPNVDAMKVMAGEADDAVDFLAIADVAGEGERAICFANARAGSFGASGISGENDAISAIVDEDFGDGFANSHGAAGDDDYFLCNFLHVELVVCWMGLCQAVEFACGENGAWRTEIARARRRILCIHSSYFRVRSSGVHLP